MDSQVPGGWASDSTEIIDDLVVETTDWRGATFAKIRAIINEADPEITEELKWRRPTNPTGTPSFKHRGIVCTMGFLKGRGRLTLGDGASLPDPQKLFNAALEGNKMRAMDFYEGDTVDELALKALIRAAVDRNLAKKKPPKARKK